MRDHPLFTSQTGRVIIISMGANEALVFGDRRTNHPRFIHEQTTQVEGKGKAV